MIRLTSFALPVLGLVTLLLSAPAALAQSIFVAIPISLTFFLPFLLSGRLGLSFWQAYGLGCLALPVGYFVHRAVARALL